MTAFAGHMHNARCYGALRAPAQAVMQAARNRRGRASFRDVRLSSSKIDKVYIGIVKCIL